MTQICTCIVCGNQNVQKVSAIANAGLWTGSSLSTGIGYGSGGQMAVGLGSGTSQGGTYLAQMLAPPVEPFIMPTTLYRYSMPLLLGFGGLLVLCLMSFAFAGAPIEITGFLSVFVAGYFVLLWPIRRKWQKIFRENEQAVLNRPRWQEALARWNTLWYCPRCDVVFKPGTLDYMPVAEMNRLL